MALIFTALSCGKGNEPSKIIIPTTNFDNQNYGCMVNQVDMQADTVYVINSVEEFAQYFNCETDPQIDFAKKTLLIVVGTAPGGVSNKTVELIQNGGNYTLNVDITLDDSAIAGESYRVAVIIDKINTNNIILTTNIIR